MKKNLLFDIEDKKLIAPRGTQPTDPLKQERDLYRLGQVKLPRSLLYSRTWIEMTRPARSLYIWLLTKREIIYRATRRGIRTDEAIRYLDEGAATTTGGEIERYAGISQAHAGRYMQELRDAGLIKTKPVKTGGRITATAYKLAVWSCDKAGYCKIPMKLLLSPTYTALDHHDRLLYLIMFSEHSTHRAASKRPFPRFEISYEQLKMLGIKSPTTLAKSIRTLEDANLLGVDHGEWVRRDTEVKDEEDGTDHKKKKPKKTGRASVYWIKTDYLYLYTEINNNTDDNNHENNRHSPE